MLARGGVDVLALGDLELRAQGRDHAEYTNVQTRSPDMFTPLKTIAAITTVAALAAGGVSIAADTATQLTVEPVASLHAGDISPFDAGGVKAIRRGKAIPPGYVIIGQKITNTRGTAGAGAA